MAEDPKINKTKEKSNVRDDGLLIRLSGNNILQHIAFFETSGTSMPGYFSETLYIITQPQIMELIHLEDDYFDFDFAVIIIIIVPTSVPICHRSW